MDNTGVHQFELTDARGQPHSYLVTEHPAGDGMEIMYALLAMGAPTVLSLAGAALKSEDLVRAMFHALSGEEGGIDLGGVSELATMLAGLDLGSVGAELGRALGTGKAPDLTRKVLSRTLRDGQALAGKGAIDLAYQANYAELLTAVWKVSQINRFFPVPSTSSSSPSATQGTAQLAS